MDQEFTINEIPNYYSVLPANVRYNKKLKPMEKIIYSEITALSNKNGICSASNSYFATLYGVSLETVSRWINNLIKEGYLIAEYEYLNDTKSIEKRLIKLTNLPIDKKINTYCENNQRGIDKKIKDNNTSINNKEIYISKDIYIKKEIFVKPTLDQVKEYCFERNNKVDYEKWFNYYTSNGWKVGKNPMKDWKAAIRTWEKTKEEGKPYGIQLN